jgi:environmental stress-induced protein Ves
VSITPVTGPGAFSAYPGIDRVLTVASGGPLMLDVDGSALVAERLSPLRFDGGATTTCVDAGGGARVVNVMARRDAASATVSVLEVRAVGGMQPPTPVRAPAGGFLVAVVVRGTAAVGDDLLTAYDAVLSLDDLDVSGPATLVVAKLEPVR